MERAVTIHGITLCFDTDFDHAMESTQWGHPERIMPTCIREFSIETGDGKPLAEVTDNHETRRHFDFEPTEVSELRIKVKHPSAQTPAALFAVDVR